MEESSGERQTHVTTQLIGPKGVGEAYEGEGGRGRMQVARLVRGGWGGRELIQSHVNTKVVGRARDEYPGKNEGGVRRAGDEHL